MSHEDLIVWKKSMILVRDVYKVTERFPKTELFGITSQMRRSAVSIPSNIAEGSLRNSTKDFIRFIHISYGSAAELQTQIKISSMLSFGDSQENKKILIQVKEILMMLNGLLASLRKH